MTQPQPVDFAELDRLLAIRTLSERAAAALDVIDQTLPSGWEWSCTASGSRWAASAGPRGTVVLTAEDRQYAKCVAVLAAKIAEARRRLDRDSGDAG